MVHRGVESIFLLASEAPDATNAGESDLDEWRTSVRETCWSFKQDMDAADDSFQGSLGAIRFIEEAYRTPGAHVATYGPMAVIPMRAAVLAALADAGSTAPSMPAEWALFLKHILPFRRITGFEIWVCRVP